MTRVAINGLGRIGRAFLKLALERPELDVVAVNDLGDLANLAYLLRFDSVYGRYAEPVSFDASGAPHLDVGTRRIAFLQHRDPAELPWADLESTAMPTAFRIPVASRSRGEKRWPVRFASNRQIPPRVASSAHGWWPGERIVRFLTWQALVVVPRLTYIMPPESKANGCVGWSPVMGRPCTITSGSPVGTRLPAGSA